MPLATMSRLGIVVAAGDDGAFLVERLAAGRYELSWGLASVSFRGNLQSRPVRVRAGERAEIAVSLTEGKIEPCHLWARYDD